VQLAASACITVAPQARRPVTLVFRRGVFTTLTDLPSGKPSAVQEASRTSTGGAVMICMDDVDIVRRWRRRGAAGAERQK
jgi:hypothetical protein